MEIYVNDNEIPDLLPISRMEEEHTSFLGTTSDGKQFWGYETFAYLKPKKEILGKDWKDFRREYIVLHLFDILGNHLTTKYYSGGMASNCDQGAMDMKFKQWIDELGNFEFGDILIKLFQTEIDGIVFGLVPASDNSSVELQPSSTIAFMPPWDGEYYT